MAGKYLSKYRAAFMEAATKKEEGEGASDAVVPAPPAVAT